MIIGTIGPNVQSTDYGVGVTGNYWGHLDCQVLRAPQYLNPALPPLTGILFIYSFSLSSIVS